MKKKTLFLFVCVLAAMLLLLVSCGEPKDADALYAKIDKKMSALDSYEIDMDMKMTFYISGYEIQGEASGHSIELGLRGDDYYFYQDMTTTTKAEELSMNETVRSLEAYHNGNYFVLNEENGVEQKLFSPLTVEEALDYRADNNMDTADFLQDCTEQAFVKKEDGSWELTYSGYTKNAIATLEEDMGLSDDMLGAGIVDMKVTFTADEKYYAKQIKLEFVFEDEKNAPVVSITMEYSKYNEAKRNTAELNVADYTQVADIRLLTDIEDMIEERGESTDASFVLELTQTVKGASGQQLSSYTEKDEVSFGEDEGGYFYDIDATIAGAKYDISYKNGKQTIKVGSQSETAAQTEQEARAYIEALINSAYYAPSIVSNIESKGDGVYKITCGNPDTAAYESAFTSMGGTFTSATQTITVTIENEQIVKIESTALAKGTVTSYGTISLLLETTVTFD